MKVNRYPADIERSAESIIIGKIRRDDETRRLGVEEGEVGVADARRGGVGHLGAGVGAADAGERGEGDVLLEPDQGGGDGGG